MNIKIVYGSRKQSKYDDGVVEFDCIYTLNINFLLKKKAIIAYLLELFEEQLQN